MIFITRLASGAILLQKDDTEICIDQPAIPVALGGVLLTLIDQGRALGEARRQGYEAGLTQGYTQCQIELATSRRIAERQEDDLRELVAISSLVAAA